MDRDVQAPGRELQDDPDAYEVRPERDTYLHKGQRHGLMVAHQPYEPWQTRRMKKITAAIVVITAVAAGVAYKTAKK